MALSFLLGIVFFYNSSLALILVLLLAIFLFFEAKYKIRRLLPYVFLVVGMLAAGFLSSFKHEEILKRGVDFFEEQDDVAIIGKVEKKEYKNEKYRLYLKNAVSNDGKQVYLLDVLILSDEDISSIGSVITVSGKPMEINEPENEGEFDYGLYLKSQRISGVIKAEEIRIIREPKLPIRQRLYDYKKSVMRFYGDYLPGEESGLLSSMILGDKTELDRDVNDIFMSVGLSHILAISGLHLSIVGAGIYRLLKRLGLGIYVSGIISIFIVFLYGLICQNPISLYRAGIMFIMSVVADILGRTYDMPTALFLSAFILIILNPFIVFNLSFVMSHMAILGIILCAKPMVDTYKRVCTKRRSLILKRANKKDIFSKLRESFVSAIIFAVMLQAFTYPLVSLYFNRVSGYVILLNLPVLFLLPALLVLGLLSGLFFIPFLLYPVHIMLFFIEYLAALFSRLPGGEIIIPNCSEYVLLIYYILLVSFVRVTNFIFDEKKSECGSGLKLLGIFIGDLPDGRSLKIKGERVGLFLCSLPDGRLLKKVRKINPKGYMKYKIISARLLFWSFLSLVFVGGLILFLKSQAPMGFRIDMLSVGQGDGIYIQSKEGLSLFVDGGSTSKDGLGRYTLLPYFRSQGIGKIDYWFVTHFDEDHVSGLLELLEDGYNIDKLCLAKSCKLPEDFNEIERMCKDNKTEIVFLDEGDEIGTKSMKIEVVYPKYPSDFDGANENSLVFLLKFGDFTGVFTGDMGSEQEEYLLGDSWFLEKLGTDVDLLKVAHHGSKNSGCAKWINRLHPEIAIISAGENNRYGHPSPETIDRLEKAGVKHFCTIDSGRVRVRYEHGKIEVEEYR